MLIRLWLIAAFGGLLYFLANRAPVIAPTPKAILKWIILAGTCLVLFNVATGHHYLGAVLR